MPSGTPKLPVENEKPTLGGVLGFLCLIALITGFVYMLWSV